MKRVLVTGGDGFIGRYVTHRLEELGIEVATYDIQQGFDVLDMPALALATRTFEPEGIIHLSGVLGTHELSKDRNRAIDVNIKGAVNVANAALAMDAKMVSIEQPHIWYNTYEATKFAARRILISMAHDEGLKVDFVTAHNAYGPGQAHGEGHPQKIIPTFATKAWAGEEIPIWGNGEQKVNLVYAGDVADQLVTRVLQPQSSPLVEWQAGIDELFTVNEVADNVNRIVKRFTGSFVSVENLEMRSGEQNVNYPEPDHTYPYVHEDAYFHQTVLSYKP